MNVEIPLDIDAASLPHLDHQHRHGVSVLVADCVISDRPVGAAAFLHQTLNFFSIAFHRLAVCITTFAMMREFEAVRDRRFIPPVRLHHQWTIE